MSRKRRIALGVLLAIPLSIAALYWAAHRFPAVGSGLADALRFVIGVDGVTKLEEWVYGLEDRYNQWRRGDEKPKAYWKVPSAAPPPAPSASASASASAAPSRPPFLPADVGAVHAALAAEGDGVWVPVTEGQGGPPRMFKTLLHPDRKRPWAELFVVAIDARAVALHWEIGTVEPAATVPEGRDVERTGLIPPSHQPKLVAGFNGGFKMQHGRWGAGVKGTTVVAPRTHGCTILPSPDHVAMLAPWPDVEEVAPTRAWWRQTPPCMVHRGKRHGALWDPEAKGWGATLEGDTVIRRSAIGLNGDRSILFVGVSNHTAAHVLADGMMHAGAEDVAQLDVNWSYPRFVVFPERDGELQTESLFPGFEVDPGEYLRDPVARDFFYLTAVD